MTAVSGYRASGYGTGSAPKNGCRSPQPKTPAQCEPTVTCEGYTFKLRKVGVQEEKGLGSFAEKIIECLADLSKVENLLIGLPNSTHQLQDVLAIRDQLISFLDDHGLYDCKLYTRINQSPLPDNNTPIAVVQQYLKQILLEMLQFCICSALLPACPPPAEDNCVPIATLSINCKGGGCHITRVCNWEHRRLVIGFPTLEYWFEALIAQSGIAGLLEKLCCEPIRVRTPPDQGDIPGVAAARVNLAVNPNENPNPNPNEKTNGTLGTAPVDDLVSNLLDEAVKNKGKVKRSSVYGQLGEILASVFRKLFRDK